MKSGDEIAGEAFAAVMQRGVFKQRKSVPEYNPSRNTKIMLMKDLGERQAVIASEMGISIGAVAGVINRRNSGLRNPNKQHFAKRPKSC